MSGHQTMTAIARDVCVQRRIKYESFLSPRRFKKLAEARWEVIYRIRQVRKPDGTPVYTYGRIAHFLKRDPSTIRHGYAKYVARLAETNRLQ